MAPSIISSEPVSIPDSPPISPLEDSQMLPYTEKQRQRSLSYTRTPSPPLQQHEPDLNPTPKPTLAVSISITKIQEKDDSDLISSAPLPFSAQQSSPQQPTQSPHVEDYDPCLNAKPYSPFYRHATPSSKLARLTSPTKRKRTLSFGMKSPINEIEGVSRPPWQRLYDRETDLEKAKNTEKGDTHVHITGNGAKLWTQKKRYCVCLAGLSKGQRLMVKGAIALVIVGSMVAVALGITAAVGGGVWSGDHQSETLPIKR
ncbi:hypothetical protein BJX70DRAFT_363881 [Aspergillus crustosus]